VDILRDARVMVSPRPTNPSRWWSSKPGRSGAVLVNATCAATMEHARRSGGGLWFGSYRSFEATVDRLASDARFRADLAEAGRLYTERFYRWDSIIGRYGAFLRSVVARGTRRTPGAAASVDHGGRAYERGA